MILAQLNLFSERIKSLTYKKCLVILFILTSLVYVRCVFNDLLWDDTLIIDEAPIVSNWNLSDSLFDGSYFKFSRELTYRPVVTLTYMLDFAVWSMNPIGFHLTNILLHGINAVLFSLLILGIAQNKRISIFSGFVFGLHPLASEAVCSPGFREDLLSAFFMLVTLLLWLKVRKTESKARKVFLYIPIMICYALALLSKENAVVLIPTIFIVDFFALKTGEEIRERLRRSLKTAIPLLLVLAGYIYIRFFVFVNPLESGFVTQKLISRISTSCTILVFYIFKFILPYPLSAEYHPHIIMYPWNPFCLFSLLLICGLTVLGVFSYLKWNRLIPLGLLWIFICLVPVLNIYPIANLMAERYLYWPLAGFALVIGVLLERLSTAESYKTKKVPVTFIICVLLFLTYSGLTHWRTWEWRDAESLWKVTYKRNKWNYQALNNLAREYEHKGMSKEAEKWYLKSASLGVKLAHPRFNLAMLYMKQSKYDEAVNYLYEIIHNIDPNHKSAIYFMAYAFMMRNDFENAEAAFEDALSDVPTIYPLHEEHRALTYNYLGYIKMRQGLYDEAEINLQKALHIQENLPEALYNLTELALIQGETEKAQTLYDTAREAHPDDRELLEGLLNLFKKYNPPGPDSN